jgi:hypothetical protein
VYPQQKEVFTKSLDDIKKEEDWFNAFFELPKEMADEYNGQGVNEYADEVYNRLSNELDIQ